MDSINTGIGALPPENQQTYVCPEEKQAIAELQKALKDRETAQETLSLLNHRVSLARSSLRLGKRRSRKLAKCDPTRQVNPQNVNSPATNSATPGKKFLINEELGI
jgi:hypothetical protein